MLKSFKAFKDNKAELSGEDLDFFCDWFMKYNKYDDAENVSHIVEKYGVFNTLPSLVIRQYLWKSVMKYVPKREEEIS